MNVAKKVVFGIAVAVAVAFLALVIVSSRAEAATNQSVLSRTDLAFCAEKDGKPYLREVGPGRSVYWEPAFPLPDGYVLHGVVKPKHDFGSSKDALRQKYDCIIELDGKVIASWVNQPAPFEFIVDTTGMSAGGAKAGLSHDITATIITGRTRTKAAVSFVVGLPLPPAPPVVVAAPTVNPSEAMVAELEGKLAATNSVIDMLSKKIAELEAKQPCPTSEVGQVAETIVPTAPAVPLKPAQVWIEWRETKPTIALLTVKGKTERLVIGPGLKKFQFRASLGTEEEFTFQVRIGSRTEPGKITQNCRLVKITF